MQFSHTSSKSWHAAQGFEKCWKEVELSAGPSVQQSGRIPLTAPFKMPQAIGFVYVLFGEDYKKHQPIKPCKIIPYSVLQLTTPQELLAAGLFFQKREYSNTFLSCSEIHRIKDALKQKSFKYAELVGWDSDSAIR